MNTFKVCEKYLISLHLLVSPNSLPDSLVLIFQSFLFLEATEILETEVAASVLWCIVVRTVYFKIIQKIFYMITVLTNFDFGRIIQI